MSWETAWVHTLCGREIAGGDLLRHLAECPVAKAELERQWIEEERKRAHQRFLAPKLPCGCPLDSGCSGHHPSEGT